jgi:Zn-dependent protease with chaperone function
MRHLAALLTFVALCAAPAGAADASPSALTPRTVDASAPIDGYHLPPDLRRNAEAHAAARHLQYIVDLVWAAVTLVLLARLRIAARLAAWTERHARRRFGQACLFAPAFLLALALAQLPVSLWAHVTSRAYGLSIQGWGSFARDWGVGQLLTILLGTVLVWLSYTVMRRSPRWWWFWAWLAMLPILLSVVFVEPFVIEPLFFQFAPLASRDPALVQRLHTIARRGGEDIPPQRMFVMEASEKVRSVNAYVTGLGAGKRVVVWDTTLAAMAPREIAFVFGHELGHYVLGHVVVGLALGAGGLLVALFLGAVALGRLVRRYGRACGVARPEDHASLPLVLLILSLVSALGSPAAALVSRQLEHKADAFGLRVIEGAVDDPQQAAAHAFQRLGEIDLDEPDPSPLVVWWLYDHPPLRDRVAFVLGRGPGTAWKDRPRRCPPIRRAIDVSSAGAKARFTRRTDAL